MRDSYGSQLQEIESEFERERDALLERNKKEIKELFTIHEKTEEYFQHERHRQEAEQNEKLE